MVFRKLWTNHYVILFMPYCHCIVQFVSGFCFLMHSRGIPLLSNMADEYCGLFLRFWGVEGVSLSFGVCYLILTYFDTCYCHFSNLLLFLLRMVMVFSRKWPGHQEQSNRTVSFKMFNCYWLFDLINLCCDILTRMALVHAPLKFLKGQLFDLGQTTWKTSCLK